MLDSNTKGRLYQAKLKGLLSSLSESECDPQKLELVNTPGGAGGIDAQGAGGSTRGFFLLGDDPKADTQIRGLGSALIWGDKHHVKELHVLVEADSAGDLARRAAAFTSEIHVWEIQGIKLVAAVPSDLAQPPELSAAVMAFAPTMIAAQTLPVDDHGRLVAEIAGLEVARVSVDEEGAYLEVGVGQADRELQMLVHGGLDRVEALERAVGMVLEYRRLNAPLHPLNRMARERWLRSEILNDPSLVGLASAEPLAPLRPRSTLLGTEPCAALGTNAQGDSVVIVCSVGVDVDLAADAADYRARTGGDLEILLVVPQSSQHPAVARTVELLDRVSFVSFPSPWGAPQ